MRNVMNNRAHPKKSFPLLLGTMVIVFFVSLSFVVLSKAQFEPAGQSVEVSPPTQEFSVDPGKTITVRSKVRNRTGATMPMTVRIDDFTASGDEGQVALDQNSPWSVTSWTSLTPKEFSLKSGETKEVLATIAIPKTGVAGGRYGAFVFSVGGGKGGTGSTAVAQEVASLFLLKINGPVEEKLSIETLTAPAFLEFGPVPFILSFKNNGNIHLKPYGLVAISDMFGNKVTDIVVTGENVFPSASRKITTNWMTGLQIGKFTARAILYTGGTKNETVSAETSFFIFPVRIAVVIITIGILLFLSRKRLIKAFRALVK